MEYVTKQEADLQTDDVSRIAFQMLDRKIVPTDSRSNLKQSVVARKSGNQHKADKKDRLRPNDDDSLEATTRAVNDRRPAVPVPCPQNNSARRRWRAAPWESVYWCLDCTRRTFRRNQLLHHLRQQGCEAENYDKTLKVWDFKTGEHTFGRMDFTPYAMERQGTMNTLGLLGHPSAVIYCLVLDEFRIGSLFSIQYSATMPFDRE
jgi:hypothetical protein